jgi:phenylalanyl-tRNA synthetase beta chain
MGQGRRRGVRVSTRWLREFVPTDRAPGELKELLLGAGIEVSSVAPAIEGLSGVLVAEVEAIEGDLELSRPGHRNRLCRVAAGARRYAVVCGAPNVRVGLRTALAPPGATLPGGGRVERASIRGTLSEGMLCSERELGIGEEGSGIIELPSDAPPGADLGEYLGLDDTLLEIEITPNRPDALSVRGLAREIAALTGVALRPPPVGVREGGPDAAALAAVEILDPDLCPRYAARVISGLTVAPSPPWLAQRLRAAGLRPINNVVDVTNYVLWELGQPLHAFDLDTIAERRIVVRRARPGERLTTLDGRDRVLTPDMLMICDATRPVAVGGVMGGADTEVTDRTTTVLLESACFHPGSIRRTARALGLSTEAAYRFERGTDIEGVVAALDRAAELMADLGGGTVARGVIDVYPAPAPRTRIAFRPERVRRLIGTAPARADIAYILRALGFELEESGAALAVTVPSFRRDVVQEDDLVEEVVRIWGYDKIPSTLNPGNQQAVVRRPPALRVARAVARALTAAGLTEVITYAFVDPDRLKEMGCGEGGSLIALQNPLSRERSVMRPALAPGLLEVVATNLSRQISDVRVFEIGNVFGPHKTEGGDRPAREELWAGLALTGMRQPRAWHTPPAAVDVYDAKGAVMRALGVTGIQAVEVRPLALEPGPRYLEADRAAAIVLDGCQIGWFGEVAAAAREAFDLPHPVFLAEVSLSALASRPAATPTFRPLPRFPGVQRDLAVVVDAEVTAEAVEAAIRALDVPHLVRVALFDVYQGSQVGPGRRSLAWSLTFQAADRTLTDEEVNALHARIVEEISRRFGAEIRGA